MRIGIFIGASGGGETIDELVNFGMDLEARGFASLGIANVFEWDAMTLASVIGRETSKIELATAVVPTYPRHPMVMAQQALTTQACAGGRFVLGIGLSHKMTMEHMLGLSYKRRAKHMREYLSALTPALAGKPTKFEGEEFKVEYGLQMKVDKPTPVVVAALGDQMLKIAGSQADGTSLWVTGPQTIESHIGPKIRAAAKEAGRPDPRIIAGLPMVLTANPDPVRKKVGKMLQVYGMLPSYQAMLEKEGASGPADVALIGNEAELDAGIQRLEDVGVTDFNAAIIAAEDGAHERTLDYLTSKL